MKTFFTVLMTFWGTAALACPGGSVQLNDDTVLAADGIYALNPTQTLSIDVKSPQEKGKIWFSKANYTITDSKNQASHKVKILAVNEDKGGIISTVYHVTEISTNAEKTIMVQSNYFGNGTTARGIGPGKTSNIGTSLIVSGCQ